MLSHPERLEQEYRRRLLQEEQTPDELSSLQARMGRLRQGIARLIDSYAEGLIDKTEFEPRIARMRERLQQIEEQAKQITDEASLEHELRLILGQLDEFASRVNSGLHDADWLTRREIIRALIKRVEIDQEQVRVVFRVNSPSLTPPSPSEQDAQSLQHCRRRADLPLWYTQFGVPKESPLHQTRFEKAGDEPKKTPISNALCQAVQQDVVPHVVERTINSVPPSRTRIKRR